MKVRNLLNAYRHTTIFGRKASQHWVGVVLWEHFFNEHPDIKAMVELGTGVGGMSIAFILHSIARGFKFFTFDRWQWYKHRDPDPLTEFVDLAAHFQLVDLFSDEGREAVLKIFRQPDLHPLVLFCDNGDKRREAAQFIPHLQPGDYVAVHDWGTAFCPEDAALYPLEPLYFDIIEKMKGCTRMWKVK